MGVFSFTRDVAIRCVQIVAATCLLGAEQAGAQERSVEKVLPMDGHISADGRLLELNWFDAEPPRAGSVTVRRRAYGETGGDSWTVLATGLGPVMRYADDTVVPGQAYEYQVLRTGKDIVDAGYWLGGTDVPAVAQRGTAWILVDETVAGPLTAHLNRFATDLIADGWAVRFQRVPRHISGEPLENLKAAAAVKTWLIEQYNADPFGKHATILVGHVPIVQSGQARPDGHELKSHGSDLFYADMDGTWRATRDGFLAENQVPGDFVEIQVGRIDFQPVSGGDAKKELQLLRAYFDKNHHWRVGFIGDLRNAYGANEHLLTERAALRNITGPQAVTEGGHHGPGEQKPWLWGVDFGNWNGANYAEQHRIKAVFALNFGSAKQLFSRQNNALTATLAQPWYPLAVGWGARPAWWLHHMALGGSIGDVHMRTVNNGKAAENYRASMDYFPTGSYLWRNPVWVNLLGDPTLRAFPLAPPSEVVATVQGSVTELNWSASPDPDTTGYGVWRADGGSHDFTLISGRDPLKGTSFTDAAAAPDARYMIRAYGKKQVYAGSFFTWSLGAYAAQAPMSVEDIALTGTAGTPLALPELFNAPQLTRLYALIREPETGMLNRTDKGWEYLPPAGFTGKVVLPFSVSDAVQTVERELVITIAE